MKPGRPYAPTQTKLYSNAHPSIPFRKKAFVILHTGKNCLCPQMTSRLNTLTIRRRHVVSFTWRLFRQILAFTMQAVFRPKNLEQVSTYLFETYSQLWDFAEHSISHQGFNLPSALGHGPVQNVNALLAKLYGMTFASLSFGGSSGALLTLLTAVLPKLHPDRDIVLFDDVCHQSAIGGLIFGRWKAVRLLRTSHPKYQTVHPLNLETVRAAIQKYGADRIAAILLVLPSYDGFRSPSEDKKIYDYAKSHGIKIIVDGAWDAMRFRQGPADIVPLDSICDVWISSPHKRGLTPSSLGCILTNDRKIARLWDEALDLGFRSSSVSFVEIMIAEHRLSQIISGHWNQAFEQAEQAAETLRNRITEVHPDLCCIEPAQLNAEYGDSTHILISTEKLTDLDARNWATTLSTEFAFDVEKATASTLLLLCGSPGHLGKIDVIISTLRDALKLSTHYVQSPKYDL